MLKFKILRESSRNVDLRFDIEMGEWMNEWRSLWDNNRNPHYPKVKRNRSEPIFPGEDADVSEFEWDQMPLTGYEVLTPYLDGWMLINLCDSSKTVEAKMMENFSYYEATRVSQVQRQSMYREYCLRDFDITTVLKIIAGFEVLVRSRKWSDRKHLEGITWEKIFKTYWDYWRAFTNGTGGWQRMTQLESKIEDETILQLQLLETDESEDAYPQQLQLPMGARIVSCFTFPCPKTRLNPMNMVVVEDFEKVNCKHSTILCQRANTPSTFQLRVMYFPILREGCKKEDIPEVERVILTLCNRCLTYAPMGGGLQTTEVLDMPFQNEQGVEADPSMDPIFEVKNNVIAIWYRPDYAAFYLMRTRNALGESGSAGFSIFPLYDIVDPDLSELWREISARRHLYIPVIMEHKGRTSFLNEMAGTFLWGGGSGYAYHPTEPTYYGLAVVSPIHGIESFRPTDEREIEVVRLEPEVLTNNPRHLEALRQSPVISAKGHGIFVFCAKSTIAVSWDGLTWFFSDLYFPPCCSKSKGLKSVDVLHPNLLMFVLNDYIVLMRLQVEVQNSSVSEGPKLDLIPARAFSMDTSSKGCKNLELAYVEWHFDSGLPFLFIVADEKPIKLEKIRKDDDPVDESEVITIHNRFGRRINRLMFELLDQ